MSTQTANNSQEDQIINCLILKGDLSGLSSAEKAEYYLRVCEYSKLDATTLPFNYLKLNGREVLYATKSATNQLTFINKLSIEIIKTEVVTDIFIVSVRARKGDQYVDEIGTVNIKNLNGDKLANAYMKGVTKAKRRAVLSICGLGMLAEEEVETIDGVEIKKANGNGNGRHHIQMANEREKEDIVKRLRAYLDKLCTTQYLDIEEIEDIIQNQFNKKGLSDLSIEEMHRIGKISKYISESRRLSKEYNILLSDNIEILHFDDLKALYKSMKEQVKKRLEYESDFSVKTVFDLRIKTAKLGVDEKIGQEFYKKVIMFSDWQIEKGISDEDILSFIKKKYNVDDMRKLTISEIDTIMKDITH